MPIIFLFILTFMTFANVNAQVENQQVDRKLDSLYINEVEEKLEPLKVLHAEPLYIDLIRDLGARKGEKEWNIGMGLADNNNFDKYTALIEYEWAPINRLGLEVELPFSFYYPVNGNGFQPNNKLNGLKFAAQYSFYVSNKYNTSMALGYIHEFGLTEFKNYGVKKLFKGNLYNPFFVAAKRWGNNLHTLLYTGPSIAQQHKLRTIHADWQINSNFHYMISGTRNFVGIEFNKNLTVNAFDISIRPQMRVGISENLLLGVVTGIPMSRETERFSTFLRLIYEPRHKKA